MLNHTTLS